MGPPTKCETSTGDLRLLTWVCLTWLRMKARATLLAVAKASRCAVLLGDFMQLGPILPPAVEKNDRADIRRWLLTDAFRHCGITTPTEALGHAACLVLDTQHRFGPHVMDFANLLVYDGLLQPGGEVRSHADDDPEIVLIDTDGLHELAQVHRVGSSSGWWPAGLLLSRALVELHVENGESTGVITPYVVQAEATKGGSFPSSFSTLWSLSTTAGCG